ncbi:MAG: 50S ribosomal protein L22 [Omnitrophica bacterium]|nr:50S ribosomal protein L22 [Candidatus Omnitrophota bacterium]
MVTRALEKYLRISPKKLRLIASMVSKKKVTNAIYLLLNTNKKGAAIIKGVIESALNNAKRKPEKTFDVEELFISKIAVNMGPALRRFRAMSMGRAGEIRKRTSHVLVELDAPRKIPGKAQRAPKKQGKIKPKKPVKAGK